MNYISPHTNFLSFWITINVAKELQKLQGKNPNLHQKKKKEQEGVTRKIWEISIPNSPHNTWLKGASSSLHGKQGNGITSRTLNIHKLTNGKGGTEGS